MQTRNAAAAAPTLQRAGPTLTFPHPMPRLPQVCGSELFTGNTAVMTTALYEGKATPAQLLKNWVGSYLGEIGLGGP